MKSKSRYEIIWIHGVAWVRYYFKAEDGSLFDCMARDLAEARRIREKYFNRRVSK